MTLIKVEINPLYGLKTIPAIGLIMKIHPNHIPAEKLGVITMSLSTPKAEKRVI
jgi:hypothetical protein